MFAGIGGFRTGLTRAGGFRCVGHCEIDKYANASYTAIYEPGKEERYYPDATKIDPADLPDFDLLCGGFPCQTFSIAGRRKGLTTPAALSSLKLPDWLNPNDLRIFCSKTFRDCCRMTKAGRFLSSSPRLMTWGTAWNGWCLTANILESRNPEGGCSLSAILIPDAPEKYFLSSAQVEKLLYKSSEARKAPVSTTQTE